MKIQKFNEENIEDTTFDWEKFKNYVDTYNPKTDGGGNWHTIMLDMLYGIGISLDEEEFTGASGFKNFREYLKTDVHWKIKKDANKYNL